MYGANTSDAQFVDLLYQNVLHREPESGGFAILDGGARHAPRAAREEILAFFSESRRTRRR
jgi:hypothetical protein